MLLASRSSNKLPTTMMFLALRRLATHPSLLRSYASVTRPMFEKVVMPVPTMGDSITEGTIVEWAVDVGQAVNEGDVVALIETDKVTIDIKAQSGGVVTQHFGQVDDTVEVGAKLYELDSDGVASSAPKKESSPAAASKEEKQETKPAPAKQSSDTSDSHRTPSIHFLGKSGWKALRTGESSSSSKTVVPDKSANPLAITVIHEDHIDSMYGRPKFTEEEMEALMMGGATIAPSVIKVSSGASFSP